MALHSTIFGIDSHLRTTTICALTREDGEVETRTFKGNDYGEMREWMASFPQPSFGVYESGCTGFVPARELTAGDTAVVPVATSKLPTSADSRSKKNDRRDAERLARLALAGEVSVVWVPARWIEGLRELSQALADLAQAREAARQRVNAILCRHGLAWDERTPSGRLKKRWGRDHWRWLRGVDLGDAGSQAAFLAALAAAEAAEAACRDLEERAAELAAASELGPVVDALMCLKGVGFATALAYAAEVGDFSRFPSGRKVASYFGLAPSERSSADRTRTGRVSKNGCALVRRLATESAWSVSRGNPALRKAGRESVPRALRDHAAACSRRLVVRRRELLARGLEPCKANTATAAELVRMMLYVGKGAQEASRAA